MSFHWCDNIHTLAFTPRDYQVELLASAFERNTMICLGHKSSKEFIALKLMQELARKEDAKGQICLYISNQRDNPIYTMLQHLTDLAVFQQLEDTLLESLPSNKHVYIVNPKSCLSLIRKEVLTLTNVHLLILEDCHHMDVYRELLPIFKEFIFKNDTTPKVLGLAGPLHSAGCCLQELSAMLNTLENSIQCQAETASDIVTVLRYCSKPTEYIVQCGPYENDELTAVLEDIINTRKAFLNDHRYDPFEIYSTDEFLQELKDIPDPKKEPMEFLDIMLAVLHEMGPWAADRVALNMLYRIEKQKIKTPHERHYILLCLVSTALHEIRSMCEHTFRSVSNHKELVVRYSSPKVLRLLEVLRLFKPEEFATDNEIIHKINQELDEMDFQKLTRSLEHSCQSVENISKQQIESRSIIENLDPILRPQEVKLNDEKFQAQLKPAQKPESTNHRRYNGAQGRSKRRPFIRRQMRENNEALDTLCAIVFCNSNYTARVLFELLAEMSRHDPDLKFIKCQYTTDRVADPIAEPKEAEQEHRRQEEVLKRFRMHDCNVLIGTSVLEEGIDVPKCNLVVRWDPPTTYRSYVQCKGRARASMAYHIILVSPTLQPSTEANNSCEQLSDVSHRFICKLSKHQTEIIESDSEDESEENGRRINQFTIGSSKGKVKILNPEVITSEPPVPAEKKELKEIENPSDRKSENLTLIEIKDEVSLTETINAQNDTTKTEIPDISMDSTITSMSNLSMIDMDDFEELHKASRNESVKLNRKHGLKTVKLFQCNIPEIAKSNDPEPNVAIQYKLDEMENTTNSIVEQLAQYREIEKMLLQRCANTEPTEIEHQVADKFTSCIEVYKPHPHLLTGATVDLSTSIALVNKYCSKLPSDTFTKLTALWRCATSIRNGAKVFQYTVRLPINSPLKYDIVGLPMATNVLARRMAAFQACIELHRCGELDSNLQPIGKEGFRAIEPDWENFELEEQDEKIVQENIEPRPGTTKRRQYYYKRIASEFCNCRPTAGSPCYLYLIDLTLQCPIPEEQNTRGRKIYPPEDAQQGFGILTLKKIPKVSSFPIFTRSGEVKVSLVLYKERIFLSEQQISCINTFLNYTFTNVLRLQKFLMLFDPDSTENCIFIVPTVKTNVDKVIDWKFLELIEQKAGMMPTAVPEEERKATEFDANRFRDAVIMPWYRNQDQPQYFYVAEICPHLTPLSCFPGENYRTFKHYYFLKYGLTIQNAKQPLLDVDHTSARLNFLTPRYVNRKGVALPTSSEETKRAKRENLEQKQILVPELCTVHPFPASLWRTAVCLPCILYRINGLLLADDIRKKVAHDIGLGQQECTDEFEWPMLDFGWSLSEVLKKSKENKQILETDATSEKLEQKDGTKNGPLLKTRDENLDSQDKVQKSANEIVIEGEKKLQVG